MKKNSWLNALENVSLVGLGAGSVASFLLNQLVYTTTPLSLLVVLGLISRRRLAQMNERRDTTLSETDQYLALQVDRLHHQVSMMPTPETINRLNRTLLFKNQETSEKLHNEVSSLKQSLHQRVAMIEQQGLGAMRQEMRQIADRCTFLMETVNQLGTDLTDLTTQVRTESVQHIVEQIKLDMVTLQNNLDSLNHQTKPNLAVLQEHITRLDRQFSKLPPPVDLSSLKQEVAELIKIVADLVPRRDLSSLVSEIKAIHEQQETLKQSVIAIETAALNFKRTFHDLPQDLAKSEESEVGESENSNSNGNGNGNGAVLEAELVEPHMNLAMLGASPSSVYPELQELAANYLGNLRTQLSTIQEFTTNLAQQQKQLREQLNQLPQTLDVVALQRQLAELSQRVPVSEGAIESFKSRLQDVLHQELQYINQQLQLVSANPHSELIFDLNSSEADPDSPVAGSRAILEQALETSQNRLIIIWPWAEQCQLDQTLYQKFDRFLAQGRQLDVGWCYLAERDENRWLSKIQRGWMTDLHYRNQLQETLHQLLQLKRIYPDRFQFKILGTSENFLVSDETFAVLGIADGLKTQSPFPELQLKFKTSDTSVIQRLIQRFDNPILEADDLLSYWNRAVTRYDLGDKAGAIADFTHILSVKPDDAITYNYRGLAYYDLGDFASATADFSESIRLAPQQGAAYCNRAFIQSEQGNQWEAISDYSQATEARPDYAVAYFYRGMTQQKLDNQHAAITDYSEAIRLAPDSPVAYYYRGMAWQKLENCSEAIADFELAAQFFWVRGSKTNAQKALKNIAKLRQEMANSLHPIEAEMAS